MLEASIPTDGHSATHYELEKQITRRKKGSIKRGQSMTFCIMSPTTTHMCNVGKTTIDILPDDVLLTIFFVYKEFYAFNPSWWILSIHVCRRWRHVIFASPRRLDLTIVCYSETPVKELLNIWPPFPIAIRFDASACGWVDMENSVIAALQRPDRVTDIQLTAPEIYDLTPCFEMMDRPLLALTDLSLEMTEDDDSIIPDNFLGGYAPSLRTLLLRRITFPALPTLFLSTTQLVTLQLSSIPTIGYMSPRLMAACLAALPNLQQLDLEFHSPGTRVFFGEDLDQGQSSPSLRTRVVLCSLTSFHFKGISQYLDDLLAQIDTPVLQTLSATFNDTSTHIPQLLRLTNCTERLGPPIRAIVKFDHSKVILQLMPSNGLNLAIVYNHLRLLSVARVFREFSSLVSRVERLDLQSRLLLLNLLDHSVWLELFRPFVAVQNLYVSAEVWPQVVLVLRDLIGERATEVLPELRIVFVEKFQKSWDEQESIQSFIAARTLSNHPVVFQQY
jgi:hypothetical protein